MNANELADELMNNFQTGLWITGYEKHLSENAATMLRQQQELIKKLEKQIESK